MLFSKETGKRFSVVIPQAFVTKGKQRLKQHENNSVFLGNGDEFEIELFNPTHNKVKAEIEINGKRLNSGIVLRPGERVFLERFLDNPVKFKFETYFVEGNDETVKRAIANNGKVSVKFFDESVYILPTITWTNTDHFPYYNSNGIRFGDTFTTSGSLDSIMNSTTSFFSQSNLDLSEKSKSTHKQVRGKKSLDTLSMETGRIEKGSTSDQKFTYDQSTFNSYYSWSSEWEIKPISTKPIMKEDLVIYCTECGSKRKKDTHKFCPQCGTKF